jgi:hypothetical protein
MISKKKIGLDLKEKIDSKATLEQIAEWAYGIFYANCNALDSKLENILITLYSMQGGPEYRLTDLQLRSLALDLIYSEEDEPISKEWVGFELLKMLAANKDIKEIASWAYEIYYSSQKLSEEIEPLKKLSILIKQNDQKK